MKSDGYLRKSDEWAVRARRDLVRCDTGWEGAEGTGLGADTGVGRIVGHDSRATLGSEATIGSGSTLGVGTTLGSV